MNTPEAQFARRGNRHSWRWGTKTESSTNVLSGGVIAPAGGSTQDSCEGEARNSWLVGEAVFCEATPKRGESKKARRTPAGLLPHRLISYLLTTSLFYYY